MKKKLIVLMIAVSMSFSTDILAAQEKNINDMTLEELKEAYLKLQSEYMELKDSQEKGYGIVSGTITYNNGIADTNSMVILLPKDGSAKNKTIELPPGYMINNVDKIDGLLSGKVGGTGEYSISHVPDGEYLVLVVSGNASTEGWFNAEKEDNSDYYERVSQDFLEEIYEESAYNLSKGMVWYKHHIEDITVYVDEETMVNYDFGKSYM